MPSAPPSSLIHFGPFELNLENGDLRKDGEAVKLARQPATVLTLLASRPGELVTREEVKQRLWNGETFVDFEHGLNFCVRQIRAALGDSAEAPHYIETLPRRGYRFIASVNGSSHPPHIPAQVAELPNVDSGSGWRSIRSLAIVACFLVAALALGFYALHRRAENARRSAAKIMLAVLPFENMSGNPEQEYVSEGLTDEIITELGRLQPERLGVIARTSTMQYRHTEKRIDQIGKELGVDYVLEGGVVRDGREVRLNAQLILAADQTHVWAESYVFDLGDVLGLEDKIAAQIVHEIRLTLNADQHARLNENHHVDAEAYEAYLKGRYFWNRRNDSALLEALKYFQQAIDRDPNYPQAYAGLADTLALIGSLPKTSIPRSEAMPRAREAAEHALQLDDSLAEAHTSLAFVKMHYDWDWRGAEQEFQRAIELNPSYATAHQWHAFLFTAMGQPQRAVDEIFEARRLDPLSMIINTDSAELLTYAGRTDDAIEQAQHTLGMDPSFLPAHIVLGLAYFKKGLLREALAETETAEDLPNGKEWALPQLACLLATSGEEHQAKQIFSNIKAEGLAPTQLAALYGVFGDRDRAFASLEEGRKEHSGSLILLKVYPFYDRLRDDPRFAELTRKVGLP
jgi:TolB-like protein/DNA-binding winged helix-turn-helix (wHTH) protein